MRSLALLAALATPASADSFDLRDVDKQAHVATSYGITLTVATVASRYEVPRWQAVLLGVATTLVLGTTKELVDEPYSWGDQAANALGASAAAVVVFAFEL